VQGAHAFFALTPSPSPTKWARGVGAHGGAPCRVFPLACLAGEGDKGGEGKKARLPHGNGAWKIVLAPEVSYLKAVPLSGGGSSPVHGGGWEGGCRKSTAQALTNRVGRVYQCSKS